MSKIYIKTIVINKKHVVKSATQYDLKISFITYTELLLLVHHSYL